jgi:quercetin dioxygenase-like cupin family protein
VKPDDRSAGGDCSASRARKKPRSGFFENPAAKHFKQLNMLWRTAGRIPTRFTRLVLFGAAMAIEIKKLDVRRFDAAKMQKINLFETERFFCDVYCLEPGQAQKPHRHEGADKLYAVLEGEVRARVGEESVVIRGGEVVLAPAGIDHGLENASSGRAAVLVFMAPRP